MTRCSTFPRATRTTTTTSSTSARRSWRPAPRSTRSSRRPDDGRRRGGEGYSHPAGPTAEAVVPAALPGVADGAILRVLRHLLPRPVADPGGVLVAGADGLVADRGRHRPGGAHVHGVPADHAPAHPPRRDHRRPAGVHPDDRRVHHP